MPVHRVGRPHRRAPTIRGWRPTGGPCAGRPRAGSGSARSRRGPPGTAPRRFGKPRTAPPTGAGHRVAGARGARPRRRSGTWRVRRRPGRPSRIDGIARPQPFIVTSAPEARRAMTTPRISTGRPSSSSHAATSAISSPARSVTVLSMCAPVSNRKPPPDEHRVLTPRAAGLHRPVLPDERVDVEEGSDLATGDHPRRGADLRREASREGDDEKATRPVARRDQQLGFDRVHDHRLLEDDVDAGLQAGDRLGGVEHVRGDDEDGVERRREPLDEADPVRFVRRGGKTDGGEFGDGDLERGRGRLADRDDDRVLARQHVPEMGTGHQTRADDPDPNRVSRHRPSLSGERAAAREAAAGARGGARGCEGTARRRP